MEYLLKSRFPGTGRYMRDLGTGKLQAQVQYESNEMSLIGINRAYPATQDYHLSSISFFLIISIL